MSRLCIQDSWLAYNPVIGCSGNCIYCFQKPKKLTGIKPVVSMNLVENEYEKVVEYYTHYYNGYHTCNNKGVPVPIAIGTDADMFDKACVDYLYRFLDLHVKHKSDIPIIIHTKKIVPPQFIRKYKNATFPIIIAMSISLLPANYEPGIQSVEARLQGASILRKVIVEENVKNVFLLHKWQPFIKTSAFSNLDTFVEKVIRIFDCSILIGLRITKNMYQQIKNDALHPLFSLVNQCLSIDSHFFENDAKEILPHSLKDIFGSLGNDYPVFRNSSCAISFLLHKADYTGTYWRKDICAESLCPTECKIRCMKSKEMWDDTQVYLRNYSYISHCDHIEVLDPMDYEMTIAQTHLLGKPVIFPRQNQKMEWFCGNYRYYNNIYYKSESCSD